MKPNWSVTPDMAALFSRSTEEMTPEALIDHVVAMFEFVLPCGHCFAEVDLTTKQCRPCLWAVGAKLREQRTAAGVTMGDVARHLRRSAVYVSDIERGNIAVEDAVLAKIRRFLAKPRRFARGG